MTVSNLESRWRFLTEDEREEVHRALRLLLKHPLTERGKEAQSIRNMADEIWDEMANEWLLLSAGRRLDDSFR